MARSPHLALAAGATAMVAGTLLPVGAATTDVVIRRITLPVQGKISYSDDFGDPRSEDRTHAGNDLLTPRHTPLVAAADSRVRRITIDNGSNEGNALVLRDADGWDYWYLHINNDTPATDDGLNPLEFAFAPGIEVGARVKAGDVVAFASDSGNAEGTSPHLHFEIHQPDGTAVSPYPSLRIAQGFRYGNYCAFDTNPPRQPDDDSAAGYWLLGADGGVFTFGEVDFHGSTGGQALNRPAVAMAAMPKGAGYWLVASDGGIFTFGDAEFHGSTGGLALNQPITGMAPTRQGDGYWLLARDGGIFTFGDAEFFGSLPGSGLCATESPAARLVASATGDGYWVATADGAVTPFGDAVDLGSRLRLGLPVGPPVLDLVMIPPTTTTTTTTTMRPTTTTRPRNTTTTTGPDTTTTTRRR